LLLWTYILWSSYGQLFLVCRSGFALGGDEESFVEHLV
jgi:hypothetical protein